MSQATCSLASFPKKITPFFSGLAHGAKDQHAPLSDIFIHVGLSSETYLWMSIQQGLLHLLYDSKKDPVASKYTENIKNNFSKQKGNTLEKRVKHLRGIDNTSSQQTNCQLGSHSHSETVIVTVCLMMKLISFLLQKSSQENLVFGCWGGLRLEHGGGGKFELFWNSFGLDIQHFILVLRKNQQKLTHKSKLCADSTQQHPESGFQTTLF